MKTIGIYHNHCMDGFAAAWVLWKAHNKDIELVASNYGDPIPDVEGKSVIIVDFSYPWDAMNEICDKAVKVTLLDHHKSAQEELQGFDHPNLNLMLFDQERSGCGIAWKIFCGDDSDMPEVLQRIQDRDLWRFNLPYTREQHAALLSYDNLEFASFNYLVNIPNKLISRGKILVSNEEREIKTILELAGEGEWFDYGNIPQVNCPPWLASDVGNRLCKDKPFAVVWFQDAEGYTKVSLRSDKNGADVSEIAKRFGGGGHKHAAGFKMRLEERHLLCDA